VADEACHVGDCARAYRNKGPCAFVQPQQHLVHGLRICADVVSPQYHCVSCQARGLECGLRASSQRSMGVFVCNECHAAQAPFAAELGQSLKCVGADIDGQVFGHVDLGLLCVLRLSGLH